MHKKRCQSCGMALGFPISEDFFSTNKNGSKNFEYCKFCYENGNFTNPKLTIEQMINNSIRHMTQELSFPKEKAENLANSIIPCLKRWKKE